MSVPEIGKQLLPRRYYRVCVLSGAKFRSPAETDKLLSKGKYLRHLPDFDWAGALARRRFKTDLGLELLDRNVYHG